MFEPHSAAYRFVRPLVTADPIEKPAVARPLRRDPAKVQPVLQLSDSVLHRHVADEIEFVRRNLESLASAIAHDPFRIMHQPLTLQTFELISQVLGAIAMVTRCKDPAAAVELIGLPELKARLQRKALYATTL